MQKLRTIRLYGKLGAKFGRVHNLAVQSTAEAMRALCVLLPDFEHYMMNSGYYAVFIGKKNISKDELKDYADDDIRIAPVIQGSKNGGLMQLVIGAALVGISFLVPGSGLAIGAGGLWTGGIVSTGIMGMVGMMGAAMALGGVVQMLSPQPKGLQNDKEQKGRSYGFSNNNFGIEMGQTIPVAYGRTICRPLVISAGIYNERINAEGKKI